MSPRRDDWIDDDEYPDDRDIEQFGEYSPPDYDPLTIGRTRKRVPAQKWTRTRIITVIVVVMLLLSIAAAEILPLLNR
jgi:hypothetical protein